MKPFKLPDNFMLGTATAALQIEGGDKNNNWYDWCEKKHIKDGTHCIRATDHYNRVEEDIALMKELNLSCYRMGLEWSRIEPEEGKFSSEAVEHYRRELALLKEAGIEPLVTLFHFSYPMWFADSGAFEEESCIDRFSRYTRFCLESFGDLVSEWITINEPNVFAVNGYNDGIWPPGKKNIKLALRVMKNLALCHIAAYKIIHEVRSEKGFIGETCVGVANHLRIFEPASRSPVDKLTACAVRHIFQGAVTHAMSTGIFLPPLGIGTPAGKGKYCDFIGINYYSRDLVNGSLNGGFARSVKEGAPVNDLGWEIYPEGIYLLCKHYYNKYKVPIYITENGTCDREDSHRTQYICDHMYEISRLIGEGIPIERYYYWTLIDNFEWIEGESAPFGLIHCDFETQKRSIRESGRLYAEISAKKALSEEMINSYLPHDFKHM